MSKTNVVPFNPLDKKNLGASVAEAMLEQPPLPLAELEPFVGIGIYAIYYTGDFPAYRPLAERNRNGQFKAPIYVGKAVPSGARKGGGSGDNSTTSRALFSRLREHADSLEAVTTDDFNIKDFYCRFLVVDDIWIPLGESLLIAKFTPLWNALIDGFGNHDPGSGRYNGLRPRWDVLHPGRKWAEKCREREETRKEIIRDVENFFTSISFPSSDHILASAQQLSIQINKD